jgi:molybdopterin-containing oxidoreductase family iron-sulfur binding subunit
MLSNPKAQVDSSRKCKRGTKALASIFEVECKGFITVGVNPVFTTANGSALAEAIKNLEFSLAFTSKIDETAAASQFVAAHHII